MGAVFQPITSAPRWKGESLTGKRLVVCANEGWGDQIMCGRYLPPLRDSGVEVVIACHPKLARLFEHIGFWTRPATTTRPIPDGDYWTLFTDLPALLGPPPEAPYIQFPTASGGGLGVVATGNPSHFNDANRSLPAREAERLLGWGVNLLTAGRYDFFDTAEIIARLDLVITVDTAAAHLTGSMGKPLWVLLPRENMDWRWGDGLHSPWYPRARLFRQERPGDWSGVLDEVEHALGRRG